MTQIEVGDVLISGSGAFIIVRRVHKFQKRGYLPNGSVTFVIQRCSWTTMGYTVYMFNDLKQMGYKPTGLRLKLTSVFDKLIAEEFERKGNASECILHCCDVIGIP